MNGYFYLTGTIIIEACAVVLLKLANGFENKIFFASGLGAFLVSFMLLSQALKTLPMGFTNAVWAGSSLLIVYAIDVLFFHEKISALQFVFIACIVIGIMGLNMTTKTA